MSVSSTMLFDEREHAVMPNEAARYLGVATKTLANWRAAGKGPTYIRHGAGSVAYLRADLVAYREAQRIAPIAASQRRRSA